MEVAAQNIGREVWRASQLQARQVLLSLRCWYFLCSWVALGVFVLSTSPAVATSIRHESIAGLISTSQSIVVGNVVAVADGLDGNVPYTEVTLQITENVKGQEKGTYTFR